MHTAIGRKNISNAIKKKWADKKYAERQRAGVMKFVAKHRVGISHTKEHNKKIGDALKGAKSYLWKGGITSLYDKIRKSPEYKEWREKILIRDNFTCVECQQIGGLLEVHHIKSFSHYPDLRFVVSNGVTLCEDCHKETDNYLEKARWENRT